MARICSKFRLRIGPGLYDRTDTRAESRVRNSAVGWARNRVRYPSATAARTRRSATGRGSRLARSDRRWRASPNPWRSEPRPRPRRKHASVCIVTARLVDSRVRLDGRAVYRKPFASNGSPAAVLIGGPLRSLPTRPERTAHRMRAVGLGDLGMAPGARRVADVRNPRTRVPIRRAGVHIRPT